MKVLAFCLIAALALGVVCPAEEGFPETPAGEFGYSLCDDGDYGYKIAYCPESVDPVFIKMDNICTPSRKLKYPPFGSNMMKWEFEITNFNYDSFKPKHWYVIDTALFNLTNEWEVKPIDVVITKVSDVANATNTVRVSVLERVDRVYRNDVIEGIHTMFKNDAFINLLNSYCDDFLESELVLIEGSFKWNSWNVFLNFYWDCLFGLIIIAAVWAFFCKLGRKQCAKKEAAKKAKEAQSNAPLL